MAFKIEETKSEDQLVLNLVGDLDEDVSLKNTSNLGFKKITVNFDKLVLINSCGIREWISWAAKIPETTEVTLQLMPIVLVSQMNTVRGLFPPQTKVESFYVPYFCEDCDVFKNILFQNGTEFDNTVLKSKLKFTCGTCKKPMEMDVNESKYFSFLKFRQD